MATYRQLLREWADENYGYVTTAQAADLDVPTVELRKLAARGALRHVSRGLYRFEDARRTEQDAYAEAVARVGDDAYLIGDAVLGLLGLAMVEPKRIKVGVPRRTRPKDPGFVDVVRRDLSENLLTTYAGIRATTVAQALIDSQGTLMTERLLGALDEAQRAGLVDPAEAAKLRRKLRSAPQGQVKPRTKPPAEASA